ncbi:MAG: hypothetical protein ACON5H_03130 [Akkermansiaceae bacterium]
MGKNGSTSKRLFFIIAFLFVAGMSLSIYLSFQPQDLAGISGYHSADRSESIIDVPERIEAAAKTRQTVTISEQQFNTWLAQYIKVRQEGNFADEVDLKGVWVRFDKAEGGRAEIVIERKIREITHTSSLYLRLERKRKENGAFTTTVRKDGGRFLGAILIGGRFGQLKVPQGFLLFTQKSYHSLAALFKNEISYIEDDIIRKAGGAVIFEDKMLRIEFPEEDPK